MQQGEKDWVRFDDEKTAKSTTAARLFSSGTTGLPKAAILSHFNFIAQHTLVHERNAEKKNYEVSRIKGSLAWSNILTLNRYLEFYACQCFTQQQSQ